MKSTRVVGLLQDCRRVSRAGSRTRSTGADSSAALSPSTLCCSSRPHINLAGWLQRAVSGAAMAEERKAKLAIVVCEANEAAHVRARRRRRPFSDGGDLARVDSEEAD